MRWTKAKIKMSRRVAKLMHGDIVLSLSLQDRERFVSAVQHADSFEDLPTEWQEIVLLAERIK